jgi:ubiquinol-cytochrome c reductase cytochrome c subunit
LTGLRSALGSPRRAFIRWFTRPGRTPRPVRIGVALVLATVALVSLASPSSSTAGGSSSTAAGSSTALPPGYSPSPYAAQGGAPVNLRNAPAKSPESPGPGGATTSFPTSLAMVNEGHSLYEDSCSACHGTLLQGQPGVAPSLIGVGAGPVDFYLSTGRMPLQKPGLEPERGRPEYDRAQINALIAFITKVGGGPPAPAANPANGNLADGLHEFTLSCAGCHQIIGRGGLTLGAFAPDLQSATALQIAEAVRMGPYLMPHFDAKLIDQHQLDSIARYVLWTRRPRDDGGWGIYNIGPIPEGMVAWFVALLAMVIVARLIGERIGEDRQ